MNPDVLTYINSFKNFLKSNLEARNYFLSDIDEEKFYEYFSKIAEKNFKQFGSPQLDKKQLESLRRSLQLANAATINSEHDLIYDDKIFVLVPNFGSYCLN